MLDGERGKVRVRNMVRLQAIKLDKPSEDFSVTIRWRWDPDVIFLEPTLHDPKTVCKLQ